MNGHLDLMGILNGDWEKANWSPEIKRYDEFHQLICRGSNVFHDYFDDAKESRVKQVPKNQESKSFKN